MSMRKHKRVVQARMKHDLFYNFPIGQWLDRFKMIPVSPEVKMLSEEFCKQIFENGKTIAIDGVDFFITEPHIQHEIWKRMQQEKLIGNELPGSNVVFEGATN